MRFRVAHCFLLAVLGLILAVLLAPYFHWPRRGPTPDDRKAFIGEWKGAGWPGTRRYSSLEVFEDGTLQTDLLDFVQREGEPEGIVSVDKSGKVTEVTEIPWQPPAG